MLSDKRDFGRRQISLVVFWLTATVLALLTLAPIVWTLLTSVKMRLDALSMPPIWIFRPTLQNYSDVLWRLGFTKAFINSTIIASGTTILTLGIGSLCAYATTRYRFLRYIPYLILLTRLFPPSALVIPYFLIFKQLRLLDTHVGLILSHLSFSLPFGIWIMRGFFLSLPVEIDEAALTDGCNRLQVLLKVILPLSLPGLSAVAIYTFIGSWNDFFFPLILTRTNARTLPVIASGFITSRGIMWGQVNAISILILLPVMVFVLFAQKGMLKGLAAGAIR